MSVKEIHRPLTLLELLWRVFVRAILTSGRYKVSFALIAIPYWLPNYVKAQNLVPNPGFEQYLISPDYSSSGINESPHWFGLEKTTDFFHTHYTNPSSVPSNFRGYQVPSSGDGYAGIISFDKVSPLNNEFLVAKLTEPLQRDQIYDCSFEVSLSNESRYGVDGIGAVVLHEKPAQRKVELGEYEYTIRNDYGHTLNDTATWIKIERQFRAEGGEQYLLIGSLSNETVTFSDIININAPWAYYYIDNVYLAPCPKPIITNFELDTSVCNGVSLILRGLDDAKNHHWHHGGVRNRRVITKDGLYVLDNHYDCRVIQQYFRISFEDCDCTISLPTLYNHSFAFQMKVSPIVRSWDLHLYDGSGKSHLRTDHNKGLSPDLIPHISAPYFWTAQLSCLGPEDKIFHNTMSGKLIIQD